MSRQSLYSNISSSIDMRAFLILFLAIVSANALSSTDYETLRGFILDEIEANVAVQATFVRLAFHDCVSDSCDGCINMDTNSANAGLQPAIDALETVKANADAAGITVTRADLFALSGVVGSEYGMVGMPGNKYYTNGQTFSSPFNFQTGRVDCDSAPYTTDIVNFPSPHMTHDEIMTYFASEFGFTDDEVVALMGAHSLGRCSEDNSGYIGPWLAGKDGSTLDNTFFNQMINDSFTYTSRNAAGGGAKGDDARFQYDCSTTITDNGLCGIMLNSDFEMFFDLRLNSNFKSRCEPRECNQAATYDTAANYATNNDDFIKDYVSVFEKMIARGYTSLSALDS